MDLADLPIAPRRRRSHMPGPAYGILPGPHLVASLARAARRSRRARIRLRDLSAQATAHPAPVALERHAAEPLRLHGGRARSRGWAGTGALGGPARGPGASHSAGTA